jgi:putative sugar O-methyltransferase
VSTLRTGASRLRNLKLAVVERNPRPAHPELVLDPEEERYLTTPYDAATPLPDDAEELRSPEHPRLQELRDAYSALDLPPLQGSRWTRDAVDGFLDRRYFRGDSLITWHYRELRRATALKYFVYASYVAARDEWGLLERCREDGAFGCWTFSYPGHPCYSRDLLESVNEITFLERQLALRARRGFRVLDIGAGYGRLAHRMCEAYDNLEDYCCVDAVPESSFVCEYYLRHRGCVPPARSVALHQLEGQLVRGSFDLAVNIHSFPECTYDAVAWWVELVASLEVPAFLIVPNEPAELLTLEPDGTRRDFLPLLERAGYRLACVEPVIEDPAVRELVRVHDRFHLFTRAD